MLIIRAKTSLGSSVSPRPKYHPVYRVVAAKSGPTSHGAPPDIRTERNDGKAEQETHVRIRVHVYNREPTTLHKLPSVRQPANAQEIRFVVSNHQLVQREPPLSQKCNPVAIAARVSRPVVSTHRSLSLVNRPRVPPCTRSLLHASRHETFATRGGEPHSAPEKRRYFFFSFPLWCRHSQREHSASDKGTAEPFATLPTRIRER